MEEREIPTLILGQYATDEITVDVNVDMRGANVYVTFIQNGVILFEKDDTEITVNENNIVIPLLQSDTSKFKAGKFAFDIRYVFPDGSTDFCNTIYGDVIVPLKKGMIDYVPRSG